MRMSVVILLSLCYYYAYPQHLNSLQLQEANGDSIVCFSLSPDGNHITTGSYHGQIKIWDVRNTANPILFRQVEGSVGGIQYSPDGKLLGALILSKTLDDRYIFQRECMTCGSGDTVSVWDIQSGKQKYQFYTHDYFGKISKISSFSFKPDGNIIASAFETIYWAGITGTYKSQTVIHQGIKWVQYLPGSQYFLALSSNSGLVALGTEKGEYKKEFKYDGDIQTVCVSNSGKYFAAAYRNGRIAIYSAISFEKVREFSAFTESESKSYSDFSSLAFSPGDTCLLFSPGDGTLRLKEIQTGKERNVYKAPVGAIAVFSQEGQSIITLSKGTIRSLKVEMKSTDATDKVNSFYTKNDSANYSPLVRYKISLSDNRKNYRIAIPSGHQLPIEYTMFSHDNKLVLTSDMKKSIIWDVRSGKSLYELDIPSKTVWRGNTPTVLKTNLLFSPDDLYVVNSKDSLVFVWSLLTGELYRQFNSHCLVRKILFRPGTSQLLVLGSVESSAIPDTLKVWNIVSGQQLQAITSEKLLIPPAEQRNNICSECSSTDISSCMMYDFSFDNTGTQLMIAYENCVRYFNIYTYQFVRKVCYIQRTKANGNIIFIGNKYVLNYDASSELVFNASTGEVAGEIKKDRWHWTNPEHRLVTPDNRYLVEYDRDSLVFHPLQPAYPKLQKIIYDDIKGVSFDKSGTILAIYPERDLPVYYTYPGLVRKEDIPSTMSEGEFALYAIIPKLPESETQKVNYDSIANTITFSSEQNKLGLDTAIRKSMVASFKAIQRAMLIAPAVSIRKVADNADVSLLETGTVSSRELSWMQIGQLLNQQSRNILLNGNYSYSFIDRFTGQTVGSVSYKRSRISVPSTFSTDGKYFIIQDAESLKAQRWLIAEARIDKEIVIPALTDTRFYSEDGSFLWVSGDDDKRKTIVKLGFETGTTLWQVSNAENLTESKNKSRIAYTDPATDSACIKDILSGKTVLQLPALNKWQRYNSGDKTRMLLVNNGIGAIAWSQSLFTYIPDVSTVKKEYAVEDIKNETLRSVIVSPNETHLLLQYDRIAKLLELQTGKELFTAITAASATTSLFTNRVFSSNGQQLLLINNDTITTFKVSSGQPVGAFLIEGTIQEINYPEDRIVTSEKGRTIFYKISTGKEWFSFISFTDKSFIFLLPDGTYYGDKAAVRKLGFVKGTDYYDFSQFDIRNNRPDKVFEAMGYADTGLIRSFKSAYEKRMKKLRMDTSVFRNSVNVPVADFANRDNISYEQKAAGLTLLINGYDSASLHARMNVWVNGSPQFGRQGLLVERKSFKTNLPVTVTLSNGINRIETSFINTNGLESYRRPLYVKYAPIKPDSGFLHFVGIGINRFSDSRNNLSWSVKDIRDLATNFKVKYGRRCFIDTLFDENVTIVKVAVLKNKLLKTGVNDKIIVAYSGHGLLSTDYNYYLSTYNVNFSQPEENGLPYDVLENLLDSIPARKKLMLIDACHSGEVDKEEMQRFRAVQDSLNKNGLQKGVQLISTDTARLGMKSSFELMQELFANVGQNTGATIISAAAGTQFALERNNLKNGVFTYSILEYMKVHPHATVSELKKVINKRVSELTAGMQVPTTRSETNSVDWEIW